MSEELIRSSAREIRAQLKNKAVSSAELLDALEARIAKINPIVNALPTLCFDRARKNAATRDYQSSALQGMPIAIKDLLPVAGVRTTWGSMLYEHHIPDTSDLLVELYGEAGRHARSAVGMGSLPFGMPVEIEMIVEVRN